MAEFSGQGMSLYSGGGQRKYLNPAERRRVLRTLSRSEDRGKALFALTLAWTGARVSEVLELRASSFQIDACRISILTLKRRRLVVREVPVPQAHMAALDQHFGLREMQREVGLAEQRLWTFCRVTAWRFIRHAIVGCGVTGRASCPRGLRHGFAVGALQAGVPLNLVQRWLGHARISTTSIYASASGPEEWDFALRFWRTGEARARAVARPSEGRRRGIRIQRAQPEHLSSGVWRWLAVFINVVCVVSLLLGLVAFGDHGQRSSGVPGTVRVRAVNGFQPSQTR